MSNKQIIQLMAVLIVVGSALFIWGAKATNEKATVQTVQVEKVVVPVKVQTNLHFDGLHANPNVQ